MSNSMLSIIAVVLSLIGFAITWAIVFVLADIAKAIRKAKK